jgi:hypothetical protein
MWRRSSPAREQLVSHYTYGLDLTSAVPASGSAAYYHFDAAGNTAQMTDASGNVSSTAIPTCRLAKRLRAPRDRQSVHLRRTVWRDGRRQRPLLHADTGGTAPRLAALSSFDPSQFCRGRLQSLPVRWKQPGKLRRSHWNKSSWLDIFGLGSISPPNAAVSTSPTKPAS